MLVTEQSLQDVQGNLERRAQEFATLAHGRIDQRRKYTNEPYIVHPAAVVELVRSVEHDEAMLCAAWLHDTVEDCGITLGEIHRVFGNDVATLVCDLTDVSRPADGNRQIRKAKDRAHLAGACARAQTIKLADLIDNTRTIVDCGKEFAPVRLQEARLLLDVLNKGDALLMVQARAAVDEAFARLK